MTSILTAAGPHVFRWPGAHGAATDASAIAAELVELGCVGIIPQVSLKALDWCLKHRATFDAEGIQVTVGLGMDGSHSVDRYVAAIVEAIDGIGRVMLDWEAVSKWETKDGRSLAKTIVDGVLQRRPDAANHVTDCPWWAPRSLPNGHGSHGSAPTAEFGRLCGGERYPQCYGAARKKYGETPKGVEGRSQRYLEWARDPSQYASLGGWEIRPTYQMYSRTKRDHVDSLLAEKTQCLWDFDESDLVCRESLVDVRRLRALGFDGVTAVTDFQKAAGLKVDGILGPITSDELATLLEAQP